MGELHLKKVITCCLGKYLEGGIDSVLTANDICRKCDTVSHGRQQLHKRIKGYESNTRHYSTFTGFSIFAAHWKTTFHNIIKGDATTALVTQKHEGKSRTALQSFVEEV